MWCPALTAHSEGSQQPDTTAPEEGTEIMAIRTVSRLLSAACVSGIATLALAGPAAAYNDSGPGSGGGLSDGNGTGITTVTVEETAWELLPIATGALGGLALAGVAATAFASVRRHSHMAHPA